MSDRATGGVPPSAPSDLITMIDGWFEEETDDELLALESAGDLFGILRERLVLLKVNIGVLGCAFEEGNDELVAVLLALVGHEPIEPEATEPE